MKDWYLTQDDYLLATGYNCPPEPEPGQKLHEGTPPGFTPMPMDGASYRYHVGKQRWENVETLAECAVRMRYKRNQLIAASDWTQLPDIPPTTKALWEPYRQALRDVTDQSGFPHNVIWPTPPG